MSDTIPGSTTPPTPDWHAQAEYCRQRPWLLNSWEQSFIVGLTLRQSITPKQRVVLDRVYGRITGRAAP